ncbi:MAG: hypothetical protein HC932_02415 [Thermales bacterium]|nr:hypothetical protein [Thermales bacterium]
MNGKIMDSEDYEENSGHVDSLQIFTDEKIGIQSNLNNICFSLIQNHLLPNSDLPSQYKEQEVAIITHEIVHSLVEIFINLHFSHLSNKVSEKSFSVLGEGLVLAFQSTFLDTRTHYTNHEYTPYLILGKGYFKELKLKLGDQKSIELKNIISEYSDKIKDRYFQMRNDLISGDTTNNELITRFDFSGFQDQITGLDCKLVVVSVNQIKDKLKSKLLKKHQIEHYASKHIQENSGYIDDVLIEANRNGTLNYKKTLHYIEKISSISIDF